jgi:hypothetical protein
MGLNGHCVPPDELAGDQVPDTKGDREQQRQGGEDGEEATLHAVAVRTDDGYRAYVSPFNVCVSGFSRRQKNVRHFLSTLSREIVITV